MRDVWDRYVGEYHDANPGITEDVIATAYDGAGRSPYDWLVEAVPGTPAPIVDLACGSGPLARRLAGARVVGIDRSAGELLRATGVRVRAAAAALPLVDGCAGAVVSSMALMLFRPLDAVLAEVRRVLRGGGTFVATLPIRSHGAPVYAAILRDLRQEGLGYPEPLGDDATGRFAAAGLRLVEDETVLFDRTVTDADDAARLIEGFYAPGAGAERKAAAVAALHAAMPVDIGFQIRRLVARR